MGNLDEILKIVTHISPNEGLEADNTRRIIQLQLFLRIQQVYWKVINLCAFQTKTTIKQTFRQAVDIAYLYVTDTDIDIFVKCNWVDTRWQ